VRSQRRERKQVADEARTQAVLAFDLRGAAGAAIDTAFVLANVVISPLLFVGAALLYVDQAARVE